MRIAATEAARRGVGFVTRAALESPVTITKHEAPVAVVLSADAYRRLVAASRREVFVADFDELARVVRERRTELGLSVADVAAGAGVGQRFVWDVEHGVARPEAPMLLDVAEVLGIGLLSFPARPRGPWTKTLADPMSDELPGEADPGRNPADADQLEAGK